MAFTTAQLAGAITASTLQFNLSNISTSQTGLPAVGALPLPIGNPMQIDGEIMYAISQPVAGTVIVRGRGSDGTAAAAHDVLSNVALSSSPTDFPLPFATQTQTFDPSDPIPQGIGQDQTLTVPSINTIYNINKASALALVLPAPTLALQGLTLIFTSQTAFAHVITATSLVMDGTGTLPHTTITFAAKQGASVTLVAENGFWNVSANNNITVN